MIRVFLLFMLASTFPILQGAGEAPQYIKHPGKEAYKILKSNLGEKKADHYTFIFCRNPYHFFSVSRLSYEKKLELRGLLFSTRVSKSYKDSNVHSEVTLDTDDEHRPVRFFYEQLDEEQALSPIQRIIRNAAREDMERVHKGLLEQKLYEDPLCATPLCEIITPFIAHPKVKLQFEDIATLLASLALRATHDETEECNALIALLIERVHISLSNGKHIDHLANFGAAITFARMLSTERDHDFLQQRNGVCPQKLLALGIHLMHTHNSTISQQLLIRIMGCVTMRAKIKDMIRNFQQTHPSPIAEKEALEDHVSKKKRYDY